MRFAARLEAPGEHGLLEFRNRILERIAREESLGAIAEQLCLEAEQFFASASCTVLAVDPAGMLHPVAAPAFPPAYVEALDGLLVGPGVGSCGSAIYHNRQVDVEDIENDPRWAAFRSLALPLGYRACCSLPIRDEDGKSAGALAVYFREDRLPTAFEQRALEICAELCSIAFVSNSRLLERERRANVDALTGLPNRAAFEDALSQLPCELPGSWALFVIDIDNLKVTNDTLGHDAGDCLLRATAKRIAQTVAPDIAFRTGGDEFTVIVRSEDAIADIQLTADAVLAAIGAPVEHEQHTFLPRATIGGAVLSPSDVKPVNVRRNADFALYHAKDTQRGGFVRYRAGLGTRMLFRRDAVRDVMQALEEDRIELRYQPVVRLESGLIHGFEALSCMRSHAGRVLPAAVFEEAFDDARVSAELTKRVLEGVVRDLNAWSEMGLAVENVAINVTSADFYLGNLMERIKSAFAERDVPIQKVVVEVTEDTYFGQRDDIVAAGIRDLRRAGMKVALDDFGTGFAALAHLLTVRIDTIKIDRSFVRKLAPEHPSTAVVRGIMQIAHDLGHEVVAEGVETPEQLATLQDMGCAMVQGYIFSRPVEFKKATDLLRAHGCGNPSAGPLAACGTGALLVAPLDQRRVA